MLNEQGTLIRICLDNIHLISDESAEKHTYCCSGASGIKVCLMHKNVLKKNSGLAAHDPYFVEISCHEYWKFATTTANEIFEAYDELLAMRAAGKRPGTIEKRQTQLGFTLIEESLLSSREARQALRPSSFMYDPMHAYYSDGVASWEVAHYLGSLQEAGIDVRSLQDMLFGFGSP